MRPEALIEDSEALGEGQGATTALTRRRSTLGGRLATIASRSAPLPLSARGVGSRGLPLTGKGLTSARPFPGGACEPIKA